MQFYYNMTTISSVYDKLLEQYKNSVIVYKTNTVYNYTHTVNTIYIYIYIYILKEKERNSSNVSINHIILFKF